MSYRKSTTGPIETDVGGVAYGPPNDCVVAFHGCVIETVLRVEEGGDALFRNT